jgi:predicted ATPase
MKGQGGSVANVLSVGLRMFALTTLDPAVHRRFLVLDEQDCWLRPDLVPRLVKIVHEAGRALGFQVLMISHHDISAFEQYADKIYQFIPTVNGVEVRERVANALIPDLG